MTRKTMSGKGQVFSIDVLFVLLPIMMILGASLQYLYLAEEQSKSMVVNSRLELSAQAMGAYVVSEFQASGGPNDPYDPYVKTEDCSDLESALDDAADIAAPSEPYVARVYSYFIDDHICKGDSDFLWGNCDSSWHYHSLDLLNNTAASDIRFMVEYDSDGKIIPGHIAGVSFIRWEG